MPTDEAQWIPAAAIHALDKGFTIAGRAFRKLAPGRVTSKQNL
jgi:hypothetical protein